MLRRAALALYLVVSMCSVTFPLAAEAQRVVKIYRIGVLGLSNAAELAEDIGVFRQALRELGWVNERALTFDERYADGRYERLSELAAELVALKVDVIFTGGTPAVEAAMKATREIPIVFSNVADPLRQKMVQSLAHPGGNVTGFSMMSSEQLIKKLALLKEVVPGIKRVAYFFNGANPATAYFVPAAKAASESLGIHVETFDVRDSEDVDKAFEKISRAGVQALSIQPDYTLDIYLKRFGELALKHRLPLMASDDEIGVLLTYSQDTPALFRQVAAYVDKILKGSNPGDLPIQQPTKFRLVINLNTAKAIGITIPQSLLVRADEVIQ